jgi:hypothetical protein
MNWFFWFFQDKKAEEALKYAQDRVKETQKEQLEIEPLLRSIQKHIDENRIYESVLETLRRR